MIVRNPLDIYLLTIGPMWSAPLEIKRVCGIPGTANIDDNRIKWNRENAWIPQKGVTTAKIGLRDLKEFNYFDHSEPPKGSDSIVTEQTQGKNIRKLVEKR